MREFFSLFTSGSRLVVNHRKLFLPCLPFVSRQESTKKQRKRWDRRRERESNKDSDPQFTWFLASRPFHSSAVLHLCIRTLVTTKFSLMESTLPQCQLQMPFQRVVSSYSPPSAAKYLAKVNMFLLLPLLQHQGKRTLRMSTTRKQEDPLCTRVTIWSSLLVSTISFHPSSP